ncbi:hypothetical protein GE09DRAFT_105842 [Coniochaeta sp. 2T2.1]|nr:hypothetical protein GE09DRAFT_105842 [Coniochaeta sp. 2T2.1]
MFSYIVGLVAFLVVFYQPIVQLLSPEAAIPQIRRTPRPKLNFDLLALEDDGGSDSTNGTIGCASDTYSVHIYSREPLVVYIEGFLSVDERAHLLDIRFVLSVGHILYDYRFTFLSMQ